MNYKQLSSDHCGESSEELRERVQRARKIQQNRYEKDGYIYCNAHMQSRDIRKFCRVNDAGQELLKNAITKLGLSARAYDPDIKGIQNYCRPCRKHSNIA